MVYWLALWTHNRQIAGTNPVSAYIFFFIFYAQPMISIFDGL